jgi:3,4-dihydroxy 2-butanone 4-phosphate synthase
MSIAPDLRLLPRAHPDLAAGRLVVLDDPAGAMLAFSAATATAAGLHFAIRYSTGLVCVAMRSAHLDALRIPDQPTLATERGTVRYTVAVDAATGIGTGISARDRARTLRVLADPSTVPGDLVRPGHVLPIRCDDSDRICDLVDDGVVGLVQLVGDDGDLVRGAAAYAFSEEHGLPLLDGPCR